MERMRFITHEGKQVLLVEMNDCTPEEGIRTARRVQRIVTAQPKESVLILVDIAGAHLDKDALDQYKLAAAYDRPYVKRSAMIGGDKHYTALMEALKIFSHRDYRYFDSKEEALEWLVS